MLASKTSIISSPLGLPVPRPSLTRSAQLVYTTRPRFQRKSNGTRCSAMAKPTKVALIYFDLPGRAEVTRILLNYAGIPFEDRHVTRDQWPELKPTTPFGQLPVLEVDGQVLAQSSAIERYAAKLAGLIPDDPWKAAKSDEAIGLINEVNDEFMKTFFIQDPEAKIKARQDALEGPIKVKFASLTKLIKDAGGKFLTGDEPTYADVALFKGLSGLVGGMMDGVPTDLLDSYPVLKCHHNMVAALPPIAKMYEGATGARVSYKPLP